jgi:hypothetical protein
MRNNEDRLGVQQLQQTASPPPQLIQQQAQQAQGQLSFIAPTEFVDLPSKGKLYPIGHPLKDKDMVEIKQMTAREEDILTNRSLLKKGVALDKLLESLLIDKTVKHEELLICDKNAVYLAARISGYGPEYTTQVVCPSCEKKVRSSFDLQEKLDLFVEESLAEISENGTFKISLPSTKWVVECRALNGMDEKRILSSVTNKTKEEMSLMDQLKMMVVSIQGVTDKSVIAQALEAMPAIDSKFLRKEYDKIVPALNLKHTFNCRECGHEEVMEVPLTADFFWPK